MNSAREVSPDHWHALDRHHPGGIVVRLDGDPSGSSEWGRWSYRPTPATLRLVGRPCGARLLTCPDGSARGGRCLRRWLDPLAALAWMAATTENTTPVTSPGGPPFQGGWIGYLSYDLGRLFERIPSRAAQNGNWPLFEFTFHPGTLAYDTATGRCFRAGRPERRPLRRERHGSLAPLKAAAVRSNFTRPAYEAAVARAIEYIRAGDVFQVNLSQRFAVPIRSPAVVYQRLRLASPAWFGAYLDYGPRALLCNSPELFFRVTRDPASGRRVITTRPIKGTRPRVDGMEEELRHSEKDAAELNMIVDLERNDLGRVCEIGSVRVTEPRTIEAHPTVYHGVAAVEGVLRNDVGFVDLLRAIFPGGSVTGAPKIRAMEIIEELEPIRRGPYCGAIGYLSRDGSMQFNVAIRTMLVQNGVAHVPVGGGIVADSEPAAEYEETLVKARAMFAALGVAGVENTAAAANTLGRSEGRV